MQKLRLENRGNEKWWSDDSVLLRNVIRSNTSIYWLYIVDTKHTDIGEKQQMITIIHRLWQKYAETGTNCTEYLNHHDTKLNLTDLIQI